MATLEMCWSESERGEIEEGRIQMRRLQEKIKIENKFNIADKYMRTRISEKNVALNSKQYMIFGVVLLDTKGVKENGICIIKEN